MTSKDVSRAAAILGRKGGSKSSPAKRAAARRNALKRWAQRAKPIEQPEKE